MNFKKFAIGAGIAAAMAFASSAYAQNLLFTNGSASTLDGLYISDSGSGRDFFSVLGMGTVYRVKVPNSPAGGKS